MWHKLWMAVVRILDRRARIIAWSRGPDLTIAPEGEPYLHRWHVMKTQLLSIYVHHIVAPDDPRGLHDHPAASLSIILSGAYREEMLDGHHWRIPGDVIFRRASTPHRLVPMPSARTLFIFGPRIRKWGFWLPKHGQEFEYPEVAEWAPHDEVSIKDGSEIRRMR